MKNKIAFILLACVLLASFVLGATGTVVFSKEEPEGDASKDRLVGVFITTEYLDMPASDQGRRYATLSDDPYTNPETGEVTTEKKYVFEGMEGISYFSARYTYDNGSQYWGVGGDGPISDAHSGFHSTDAGDSIELKGTAYVSTAIGSDIFYFNPVYQTAAGEVYLLSGQGMSCGGEISTGMSGSHGLKEEQTVTVDGKSETIYSNIEVSIHFMDTPVSTSVLQFAGDGSIVSKKDYAAGALPQQISADPHAEYIIVETHMNSADGKETVTRELFQQDQESLFAFSCREDGICIKQYSSILWGQTA